MPRNRQDAPGDPTLDIRSVVAAFSEEQVERMVALSKRRLRYWASTNFFQPSFVSDQAGIPFSRFYSFKDIVALRTLEMLRVQNGIPLQHLRKVADKLSHLSSDLWTKITLFTVNKEVHFVNEETGRPEGVLTGQYVLGIPLKKIIDDTTADIVNFSRRRAETLGLINKSRGIARNAPVVAGTRVPVSAVRRLHEDGYTDDAIVAEYPDLTQADIKAALAYDDKKAA